MADPCVRLFLDLVEDRRLSMENYAAELVAGLNSVGQVRFDIFRPRYFAPWGFPRPWRDRFARYVGVPYEVRGKAAAINHVIDHGYAHLLAVLPATQTVVTAHDVIPILASRGLLPGAPARQTWLSEFSARFLRRARAIAAVSENTRVDLVKHVGVPENKIHVVPNGLSPDFKQLSVERDVLRSRFGLPTGVPILLITGTQFYKNHIASVRVLRQVWRSRPDVHMACMGKLTLDAQAEVDYLGMNGRVHYIRPSSREQLVALYNCVDCLLFPSLYEGFGWPVLEAMASGTPVVCSSAGALPEVAGEAALLAPPQDISRLAVCVTNVLTDDGIRGRMVENGFKQAAKFSWTAHARGITALYQTIC